MPNDPIAEWERRQGRSYNVGGGQPPVYVPGDFLAGVRGTVFDPDLDPIAKWEERSVKSTSPTGVRTYDPVFTRAQRSAALEVPIPQAELDAAQTPDDIDKILAAPRQQYADPLAPPPTSPYERHLQQARSEMGYDRPDNEDSYVDSFMRRAMFAQPEAVAAARAFSEKVTTPELDDSMLASWAKGFAGGATEGAANMTSGIDLAGFAAGAPPLARAAGVIGPAEARAIGDSFWQAGKLLQPMRRGPGPALQSLEDAANLGQVTRGTIQAYEGSQSLDTTEGKMQLAGGLAETIFGTAGFGLRTPGVDYNRIVGDVVGAPPSTRPRRGQVVDDIDVSPVEQGLSRYQPPPPPPDALPGPPRGYLPPPEQAWIDATGPAPGPGLPPGPAPSPELPPGGGSGPGNWWMGPPARDPGFLGGVDEIARLDNDQLRTLFREAWDGGDAATAMRYAEALQARGVEEAPQWPQSARPTAQAAPGRAIGPSRVPSQPPARPAAPTARQPAAPEAGGIGQLTAAEVASLKAQGIPDDLIQTLATQGTVRTVEQAQLERAGVGPRADLSGLPPLEERMAAAKARRAAEPTQVNGSGESAASAEALSRQAGMKARGERFVVVDRAGNERPLIGPDAVDYRAQPGETYGIRRDDGSFQVLDDRGGRPTTGERVPVAQEPAAGEPDVYDLSGEAVPDDLNAVVQQLESGTPAEQADALAALFEQAKAKPELQPIAEQLSRELNVDPVTGGGNRRAFDKRPAGAGRRLVFRGDMDNFKAINDALGHAEGDRALKVVYDALRQRLREGDVIARKGGDEFAIDLDIGEGDPAVLRDELERLVSETLAREGLGEAGGRKVGMSLAWGEDEGAADLAALARKRERGVSKPRSRAEARRTADQDTIDEFVQDAVAQGYDGDVDALRTQIAEALAEAETVASDLNVDAPAMRTRRMLEAIRDAGGLHDTEGELDRLWEMSAGIHIPRGKVTARGRPKPSTRFPYGGIAGVGKVLVRDKVLPNQIRRAEGLSLDEMAEALRQNPEFEHITDPKVLLNELEAAVEGLTYRRGGMTKGLQSREDVLRGLYGIEKGKRWWDPTPEMPKLTTQELSETFEALPADEARSALAAIRNELEPAQVDLIEELIGAKGGAEPEGDTTFDAASFETAAAEPAAPKPMAARDDLETFIGENPPARGAGEYESFRRDELENVGEGAPGLEVRQERLGMETVIAYRDSNGQPLAAARVVQTPEGPKVFSIAAGKDRGLAAGRAVKAVIGEIEKLDPVGVVGGLSEDAQNLLRKYSARRARGEGVEAQADVVIDQTEAGPQARLPGDVGAVRDLEVPTPQEELPAQSGDIFGLEAPKPKALKPKQATIADAIEEAGTRETYESMLTPKAAEPVAPAGDDDKLIRSVVAELRGQNGAQAFEAITGKAPERGKFSPYQLAGILERSDTSKYREGALKWARGEVAPAPEPVASETGVVPVEKIEPRHPVRSEDKVERLAESMKAEGWKGRPALVLRDGDDLTAWTATHRLAAAEKAGLAEVPTLEVDAQVLRDAGFDVEALTKANKAERKAALRKAGLEDAARLLDEELPANVEDFLTRQLGYTKADVEGMTVEEARRLADARIVNPNKGKPAAPSANAPTEDALYAMVAGETKAERKARLLNRAPADVAKILRRRERVRPVQTSERDTVVYRSEGTPVHPVPPMDRVHRTVIDGLETLKKNGKLTPAELNKLRGAQVQRAREMKRAFENGNFKRYGELLDEVATEFNNKQLRSGDDAPPRVHERTGEILGSGLGVFQSILDDPAKWARVAKDLWMVPGVRQFIGGVAGGVIDDEDRFRGALYGAILAGASPSGARALAHAWKNLKNGKRILSTKWLPQRDTEGRDISWLRMLYAPSPERTVPELFKELDDTLNDLMDLWADPNKHNVRSAAFRLAKTDMAKAAREFAEEASRKGHWKKAKYAETMARRIEGKRTAGQIGEERAGLKAGFTERHLRGNIYRMGIGFALDSAFQNLSQPVMTVLWTGVPNVVRGYRAAFTSQGRLLAKNARDVFLDRLVDETDDLIAEVKRAAVEPDSPWYRDPGRVLRTSDNFNRRVTYLAALAEKGVLDDALRTGTVPEAAGRWAESIVRKTQGHTGPLGNNPFHKGPVAGTASAFQKYPGLWMENFIDAFNDPEAKGKQMVATLGVLALAGHAMGIDIYEMLMSGGRPLGLRLDDPKGAITSLGGLPVVRGAKDIASHVAGTADHDFAAMPGQGFLDSDLAQLTFGRYPVKLAKAIDHIALKGYGPGKHPLKDKETFGHTGSDELTNLLGLKTTEQVRRQEKARGAAKWKREMFNERRQESRDRREAADEAFESGDTEAQRRLLSEMTPAQKRQYERRRRQTTYDRMRENVPRDRRDEFDELFGGEF